jgi:cellulose synthase/poly-beta-1,6-N-acetylglucosamine synthase-like glycosyltransferase
LTLRFNELSAIPYRAVLNTLLAAPAAALAGISGYLLVLSCAAMLKRQTPASAGGRRHRFAILVPARDEETTLGRLLNSIQVLDYPRDEYDVFVVADNCQDQTASVGRAAGATVFERLDRDKVGKGFAVGWLFDRVAGTGRSYDAYLIVDADSIVSSNLLSSMDARLEAGQSIVQAYHGVLNRNDGPLPALRHVGIAGVNLVRPLGRSALGLSCGLRGNGMCIAATALDLLGREWMSLNHDGEMHLVAVSRGLRVDFAPEARVQSDMPSSPAESWRQNQRWERSRLRGARRYVPGALRLAIRDRRLSTLDAVADIMVPPLSALGVLAAAVLIGSIRIRRRAVARLAVASIGALTLHLATALAMAGAPNGARVTLAHLPPFVGSKVLLYAGCVVRELGRREREEPTD